jgi:hypothetical protein
MDLSTKKHYVIAIYNNKLQLWDPWVQSENNNGIRSETRSENSSNKLENKKPEVTYGDLSVDLCGKLETFDEKIKCNRNIMMVKFRFHILNIYDIYTGRTIAQHGSVCEYNICDTHMIMSQFGRKEVTITDLKTKNDRMFNNAMNLFKLCINSNFVAGLDLSNDKLVVYDHNDTYANKPVFEMRKIFTNLLMTDKHIVIMDKNPEKNSVEILSIGSWNTELKIIVAGFDCKMWSNPINNNMYVSSCLTISKYQIIKIDAKTLQQTTIFNDSGNFAIGTAIAHFTPENMGQWPVQTYYMNIQSDEKTLLNKCWNKSKKHFSVEAVVLSELAYIDEMLVEYIIPDITSIILTYIKN